MDGNELEAAEAFRLGEDVMETYPEALRYDACIFDLDGVITKSAVVHRAAWKELFDDFLSERKKKGQSVGTCAKVTGKSAEKGKGSGKEKEQKAPESLSKDHKNGVKVEKAKENGKENGERVKENEERAQENDIGNGERDGKEDETKAKENGGEKKGADSKTNSGSPEGQQKQLKVEKSKEAEKNSTKNSDDEDWKFSDEDYRKYVDGLPRYDGVETFLKSRGIQLEKGDKSDEPGNGSICALGNKKDAAFSKKLHDDGVEAYPGSVALLKDLRKKGVKTAVASSSRNCQDILRVAGIENLFDARIDGTTIDALNLKGKPAPDIFLKACEVVGCHPSRSIVYEDAVSGVAAGSKGHFGLVVGIDRGGNRDDMMKNGADWVVDDLDKVNIWLLNDSFPMSETDWTLLLDQDADLEPKKCRLSQTLSTLGNGYFATLGAPEETEPDEETVRYNGTYILGGYNRVKTKIADKTLETEEFVNLPNWTRLTWKTEDVNEFFTQKGSYKVSDQTSRLNIKSGMLARSVIVTNPSNNRFKISSQRIVHMKYQHVGCIKYSITSESYAGKITIKSSILGSVRNKGASRYSEITNKHWNVLENGEFTTNGGEEGIYLSAQTTATRFIVSWAALTRLYHGTKRVVPHSIKTIKEGEDIHQEITFEINQGQTLVIEKIATLYTSRDRGILDPQDATFIEMNRREGERFYTLLRSHELVWESVWKRHELGIQIEGQEKKVELFVDQEIKESLSRLRNVGGSKATKVVPMASVKHSEMVERHHNDELASDLQFILRFNLFHLCQTANISMTGGDSSVPARGLTGESYRGHIFWDELFMIKALISKAPEIARTLLFYRYYRLNAAKDIARKIGRKGACFPWQSGSSGREETSLIHYNYISGEWYPDLSWHQRHVNIAIFYNFWTYSQSTNDYVFTILYGAETMLEIARFWGSMCEMDEKTGRYVISGVMGPDEFHEKYPDASVEDAGLRNNAYTNVMVAWLLARSLELLDWLPLARVKELRSLMALTDAELTKWRHITEKMTVIFHQDLVISQFEGYDKLKELDWDKYRSKYGNIGRIDLILKAEKDSSDNYKLAKQADTVMLFYLLGHQEVLQVLERMGYPYSVELIYKTIRYYFDRCTHGSTLSLVVYSYTLFDFDTEESWHLYKKFVASDLVDVQGGTSAEGIHIVPMAASYNLLFFKLMGIIPEGQVLTFNPRVPAEVRSLRTQFLFSGKILGLEVNQTSLKVSLKSSATCDPVQVRYKGKIHVLAVGESTMWLLRQDDEDPIQKAKDSIKCIKLPKIHSPKDGRDQAEPAEVTK
eukprot:TRINITY_DN7414_c0_g1_i1.p1 TRINITY_DN7414_c0_g1~~TRINITY_DN7414_c0_g1_i1.p1  ORF type:complete len:1305 (+),score=444.16 TRINITY_DN7414_c0_g1_i1:81-3995(+)